jgi:hypothetical protein
MAQHFQPRGWAEVGERFFAAARWLAATPPRPVLPPRLAQGELFRPAAIHPRAEPPPPPRALRLVLAQGWLPPGPQGAVADPRAEMQVLRFTTDAAPGEKLGLFLQVRVEDAAAGTRLTARPTRGAARELALPRPRAGLVGRAHNLRVVAEADAEGVVELALTLSAPPGAKAAPRLTLLTLAHAAQANMAARLELLEALLLED